MATPARCDSGKAIDEAPLRRVSARVWRVAATRGEPDEANAGLTAQLVVVRDGARVWLIGSGPTPAFGAALACAIRRDLGQAVTDVVNTRSAPELAMGNVAFAAARLWALPDVITAMGSRCTTCQQRLKARIGNAGDSLQPDTIRVPSLPVGPVGARAGALGPFTWRALERAPGERVLVLRHRRERIVIAQGLLWAGDIPDLHDTQSASLRASWVALHAFAAGTRLLGEQGDAAAADAITAHIDYLDTLRAAVLPHLVRGDVEGTPESAVPLADFADQPGHALVHPLNVQRIWREREPELFR